MLRHEFLVDHIKRTGEMNITEFTKYTEIANAQIGPTNKATIEVIEKRYFKFVDSFNITDAGREKALENWEFIARKLEMNAGLAEFTLDYRGMESLYFFPWVINVSRSPSTALEMAYGAGEDIFGKWHDHIDVSDPIMFFVENDPTFVYNRERQLYVADLVSIFSDKAATRGNGKPAKVVDFGAGNMAWARWHGVKLNPNLLDIYAYDKDPSINPETLFNDSPSNLGIKFKHGDIMMYVNDPEAVGAELIILGGVATYIPKQVFVEAVLMPIYHLLKDGGVFFYDLQVDCPYLRRSMSIFEWPKMYLDDRARVADVVAELEEMRKKLWQNGLKFSTEYAVDTYNEFPSAVMVTLQKI